jgi:hypothetical protein
MAKKNTKVKPAYIVDITNAETVKDVKLAFALAKFNSNIALSTYDLEAIIDEVIDSIPTAVIVDCVVKEKCEEKKPWYKRLWSLFSRNK